MAMWVAAAAALAGCNDPERAQRAEEEGDTTADTGFELDADQILELAASFSTALVQVSAEPEFDETHADAAGVVVWSSAEVVSLVSSIDPDDPTQRMEFPPGTLIVKEHLDEAGATRGSSVMYKGEEGYFPDGGDWFWARIDGETTTDVGRVAWCSGCHAAAHNTDFVVGFGKSP